jgi:hypothetical protein
MSLWAANDARAQDNVTGAHGLCPGELLGYLGAAGFEAAWLSRSLFCDPVRYAQQPDGGDQADAADHVAQS